jgi:hypothetical protein
MKPEPPVTRTVVKDISDMRYDFKRYAPSMNNSIKAED